MSKYLALVHRLSGLALAAFLPLHFWALGKGFEMDAFLRWTDQPLVKAAEWTLVVLLAAHLGGGLRVLAIEFLAVRERTGVVLSACVAAVACIGLLFLLNV